METEEVAATIPGLGPWLKAAGAQHLASNKAAFNNHANKFVSSSRATSAMLTAEAEAADSSEQRAMLAMQALQAANATTDAAMAQKELNDMSTLLPFKDVIRLTKDGDQRKAYILSGLAAFGPDGLGQLAEALDRYRPQSARPLKRHFKVTAPVDASSSENEEGEKPVHTCFICDKLGHRFRDCPNLKTLKGEEQERMLNQAISRARGTPRRMLQR